MLTVALIGQTNVGKSTIFNCLTQSSKALVGNLASLTRDCQLCPVNWHDLCFNLMDTPGFNLDKDIMSQATNTKVRDTIGSVDIILFVCDLKQGVTSLDLYILNMLRSKNKKVILVVNKADNSNAFKSYFGDFYSFGIDPIFISAITQSGFNNLYSTLKALCLGQLCSQNTSIDSRPTKHALDEKLKLVVIGCPNVGKSTLVNALIKESRLLVTPLPGTTRDSIYLTYNDATIIDTARHL